MQQSKNQRTPITTWSVDLCRRGTKGKQRHAFKWV